MTARKSPRSAKIAALILAAGEGSRMGYIPKCLIRLDHQPMILRQIQAFRLAGISNITVVTGFHHEQIESLIATDALLNIVRNTHPEAGQQSSVGLGIRSIQGDPDLTLIALADQPLINQHDIEELVSAFFSRPSGTEILYPLVHGQRGNPVLMSATSVKDFLDNAGEVSCRKYIDTHESRVYKYSTSNNHYLADLDTPDDMQALSERTGLRIEF